MIAPRVQSRSPARQPRLLLRRTHGLPGHHVFRAEEGGGAGPGKTILVNGISGTLGLGAVLLAPALGLTTVYGTARDKKLLKTVADLAPNVVQVHSLLDGPVDEWIHQQTGGRGGVDIYVDALGPPGAAPETFQQGMRALARGGTCVNIGALMGDIPVDLHNLMDQQKTILGSAWSTAAECQEMADMVAAGVLDLSPLEHSVRPPLTEVNEAISDISSRNGGFTNFIVSPSAR